MKEDKMRKVYKKDEGNELEIVAEACPIMQERDIWIMALDISLQQEDVTERHSNFFLSYASKLRFRLKGKS